MTPALQTKEEKPEALAPFEVRAEAMLSRIFRGMHHVSALKKFKDHWTCVNHGDCATFDWDTLTRIVLGAHAYCLRVEVCPGGPGGVKLFISPRQRSGGFSESHPTIQQAIEKWENRS